MVTYRTTDNERWGAGKGSNLTPIEIDENFWQLDTRITVLEQNPIQPNQIESFQVTGTQMTVRMQDGTVHGPFTLPTAMIHYRGDWTPGFTYSELDLFTIQDDGLYLVLRPHQSADEFDPNAVNATGNALYRRLMPMAGSVVSEAPQDDQIYGRQNGAWTVVEGAASIEWNNITNKPSTFPPSQHFHTFLTLTDTPTGFGYASQLLAINPTRTGFIWVDRPSGGAGGGILATNISVPFVNADFEDATDLAGWTVEQGSVTAGVSSGNGYAGDPYPQQDGTQFLKHDVADSAPFEVSQIFDLDFANGGLIIVRLKVLQTGSLDDIPFVRLTYYDIEENQLDSVYKHAPATLVDLWQWQSVSFIIPENTTRIKFGFGGEYNSGTITNSGIDAISALGVAFSEPETIDPGIQDAPVDDNYFVRRNNSWHILPNTNWNDIIDKPELFPAIAHTHAWDDITDKPTAFPSAPHGHAWGDISERPVVVDALPASVGAAGRVLTATAAGSVQWQEPPSAPANTVTGDGSITQIIALSQAEYDALDPKDPNTLYVTPET